MRVLGRLKDFGDVIAAHLKNDDNGIVTTARIPASAATTHNSPSTGIARVSHNSFFRTCWITPAKTDTTMKTTAQTIHAACKTSYTVTTICLIVVYGLATMPWSSWCSLPTVLGRLSEVLELWA